MKGYFTMIKRSLGIAGLVAASALAMGSPASAEERKLDLSMTLTGTSDYMFRGFSQTQGDPAFQMSVDATYGIFYAGIWGSNIDLDDPPVFKYGSAEIDFYMGLKPVTGPITWDLGVLYYYYPGSDDPLGDESDYVEFKVGASLTPIENASLSGTFYWTPDNFGETGDVYTIEGGAGYALPAVGIFTPTISGALGYVNADEITYGDGTDDNYVYWNAGIALAVDKWTLDFRYWDTNIGSDDYCGPLNCDARFVFSAKITLP